MPSKPSMRSLSVLAAFALWVPPGHAQALASSQPESTVVEGAVHPGPVGGPDLHVASPSSHYALGTGDVLHVNVWKTAELSETVTVGPDGFVSLPLLGDIHVAGLTTNELARDVSEKLTPYMVNAQVSVSIVEIRSRQVFITGQVGKPGAYPLISPISVLQMIAQAGGLNTFAKRKGIFVLRTANSQIQKLRFDYISAIHGDLKQNFTLEPGDTVIVP